MSGYLRVMGASYVPAAERDRAEAAVERFLGRVWEDSSSFELDLPRFERAYRELESIVYEDTAVNTVLAPVVGVAIAGERWELGSGVTLARGDLVDAPPEAVWGSGREGEEPHTLVMLTVRVAAQRAASPDGGARRVQAPDHRPAPAEVRGRRARLDRLVAHRRGPVADDAAGLRRTRARCAATGSRSRSGPSWRSCSSSRARVMRTADRCRGRSRASSSAASSASRSKGCRTTCLRCGRCSIAASRRPGEMARRVGALCAEPAHREAVQETVEQAFRLERLVMRGDVDAGYLQAIGVSSPDAVVSELEDNLRALLRDMVCGHLALDLHGHRRRAAAHVACAAPRRSRCLRRTHPILRRRPSPSSWCAAASDARTKQRSRGTGHREEDDTG